MRAPAVAGQFYPGSPDELRRQLDGMFSGVSKEELPVLGAVVPHAGYVYSGAVAAEVYARLPSRQTYVILGPNHHGMGAPVALSRDSWPAPWSERSVSAAAIPVSLLAQPPATGHDMAAVGNRRVKGFLETKAQHVG